MVTPSPGFYDKPVETFLGDSVPYGEFFEQSLPKSIKNEQVAYDMDGTMFKEDLALRMFVEMLSDFSYWRYTPEQFENLLLPNKFQSHIKKIENGDFASIGISSQVGGEISLLREDIVRLYKEIYKLKNSGAFTNTELIQGIMQNFTVKMLRMDRLLLNAEKAFNGDLLMRIRFFAHRPIMELEGLIDRVIINSEGENLIFKINKDFNAGIQQVLSVDELSEIEVAGGVNIVTPSYEISRAMYEFGANIRVVTTNMDFIAQKYIEKTKWGKFLIDKDTVAGTQLRLDASGNHYHPEIIGDPIYGDKKVETILRLMEESHWKRKLLAAVFGDSISNDGPMIRHSLENGGIAGIVTSDPDKTRYDIRELIRGLTNKEVAKLILIPYETESA